jgi:hypothetical protein
VPDERIAFSLFKMNGWIRLPNAVDGSVTVNTAAACKYVMEDPKINNGRQG